MYTHLTSNLDGSYTFIKNGLPYNCPNTGDWKREFSEVDAWAKAHPDKLQHEQPVVQTLEDLKAIKLSELEMSYDARISGSFATKSGYNMQFDTTDAVKMEGAVKLLEATGATEGYLTQANDETVYNVPLDTMKTVLIEMMTAFAACHARKQELRSAIKAAETVEELDAIEITWPL